MILLRLPATAHFWTECVKGVIEWLKSTLLKDGKSEVRPLGHKAECWLVGVQFTVIHFPMQPHASKGLRNQTINKYIMFDLLFGKTVSVCLNFCPARPFIQQGKDNNHFFYFWHIQHLIDMNLTPTVAWECHVMWYLYIALGPFFSPSSLPLPSLVVSCLHGCSLLMMVVTASLLFFPLLSW